jgi:hypothetical protein
MQDSCPPSTRLLKVRTGYYNQQKPIPRKHQLLARQRIEQRQAQTPTATRPTPGLLPVTRYGFAYKLRNELPALLHPLLF